MPKVRAAAVKSLPQKSVIAWQMTGWLLEVLNQPPAEPEGAQETEMLEVAVAVESIEKPVLHLKKPVEPMERVELATVASVGVALQ